VSKVSSVEVLKGSLQGQILIAQPSANSTFFAESVVLVCEHHKDGAWGLMLNKPSQQVGVSEIARDIKLDYDGDEPVYIGGPVHTDGLHFIHTPDCLASNTFWVTNTLCVTSSVSILREIIAGRGPKHWRMCLGLSSWSPGQLEGEQSGKHPWTEQHRWLTQPVPKNVLELPPQHLWKAQTHNAIESSVKNFLE